MNEFTVESKDMTELGDTKLSCTLSDHVKHRSHVGRRPAYDVENVAGGCLVFERLLQLAFAGLLGFEEPRVLDGDDSLVGESLKQTDLLFSEWSHFGAANANGADRFTLLPLQWNSQRSSEAIPDRHRLTARKIRPGCS